MLPKKASLTRHELEVGYRSIDTAQSYFNEEEMAKITALDTATSSFFSHQDPAMVEWFVKMVEERKKQQDSSKEKKAW